MPPIKKVSALRAPIHLLDFRDHHVLRDVGFVRGQMRGRYRGTECWPDIYRMIIRRNTSVAGRLHEFGPER